MRKAKRGGGDLTRNSCKNRKARKTEWISGRLRDGDSSQDTHTHTLPQFIGAFTVALMFSFLQLGRLRDGDSSQDVCTKLSDWGKSVVSISLCNGDITLFSCSGMAIGHNRHRSTRFLTSASLVRAFDGKTNEHYFDLKIEVRREGKEVYRGFLAEYDLVHNFAVVQVSGFRDVNVGTFHRKLKSVPHGEACVVGRDVSGDLTAKSVELGGDLRVHKDDKDLDSKTSKAWEGATVFSFDGEVVGMNLFLVAERAVFLPWGTILKWLERYWTSWEKARGLARSTSLVDGFGAPVGGKSNSHPEEHRDCLNQEHLDIDDKGYPKLPSTMLDAGMILVNTFEEPFGDIRGKGGNKRGKDVWTKLGEKASSRISRSVVALASFNGEKRNFACTGFFIRWNGSTKILTSASLIRNSGDENNIVENLRIEVLLPSSTERINGTLEHYDLHYNVALVSVKNHYDLRPANTLPSRPKWCSDVAAVGRCFESSALMAMSGKLISSRSALDCLYLVHSSCKITKLGIGGPLITLDGDILGMNFYDEKIGTPFMFWQDIAKVLSSFEKRSKTGENFNDTSGMPSWKMDRDYWRRFNRWPVPMPCWRRPDYVDEDEDKFDADEREYCYLKGVKFRQL